MGRKAHANYIDAALEVLQDLGGGPISTKILVEVARERELIGDGKWAYHNFSRKVRESDLFDTSTRGQIRLVRPLGAQQAFPGPTLGAAVAGSEERVEDEFGAEGERSLSTPA